VGVNVEESAHPVCQRRVTERAGRARGDWKNVYTRGERMKGTARGGGEAGQKEKRRARDPRQGHNGRARTRAEARAKPILAG